MMYIRYPLWLRQVEDILFERGIDVIHGTIQYRWNRFGPKFAAEIRKRRVDGRNDTKKRYDKPKKDIWLRPLRKDWKRVLNR